MGEILKDLDFCFTCIDDILVFSRSPNKTTNTSAFFSLNYKNYGILLNPSKCVFRVPEISILEYKISSMVSQLLPERVDDLQACPPSKNISQFRRFLGTLSFYRRFLPHAATIQAALHDALSGPEVKDSHPVTWNDTLVAAFNVCKTSLSQATVGLIHIQPLHSP